MMLMHQWAANIIKCKALVANIQELRKMYWIMTLLLSYNRFESKGLTRDRLLPIWVNLSRKEPKPQNLAMSHFTQINCKSCTSDKYQLTTLSNSYLAFYDFIYYMNICWSIIYLFFWCLNSNMTNMNKFLFITLLTYIQLINWIEDLVLELL